MSEQQLAVQEPMSDAMAETAPQVQNLMANTAQMNQIYKMAKVYANSTIVPVAYQNNPSNCFVACELAGRMNVSVPFIMQNLYVVQGRPSWSGQACKAMIDGCGKFRDSEFVFVGEPGHSDWGCYLQALSLRTGKLVKGPIVSIQMAADEGWSSKGGSKWKTMPDLMLRYRAAAFFARTECPEVLMGFSIEGEVEDLSRPEPEKITIKMEGKQSE